MKLIGSIYWKYSWVEHIQTNFIFKKNLLTLNAEYQIYDFFKNI